MLDPTGIYIFNSLIQSTFPDFGRFCYTHTFNSIKNLFQMVKYGFIFYIDSELCHNFRLRL